MHILQCKQYGQLIHNMSNLYILNDVEYVQLDHILRF